MAGDIQIINGTPAKIVARLINFETAKSILLDSHISWLDQNVAPVIRFQQGSWVDLIGYASKRGNAELNRSLSFQRCESVKGRVAAYANQVNFQIELALGESKSKGDEHNNDGQWRAVEIFVYSFQPPLKPKIPPPVEPVSVRRITHRSFFKIKVTKIFTGDPSKDPGNDTMDLLKDLMEGLINPEAALGDEQLSERRIASIPTNHRVNRVTIDVKLNYDWAEKDPFFVQTANVTSIKTALDYEWGPPFPHVEIVKKYQPTIFGEVHPPTTTRNFVLRNKAESMPLVVPPNII